jgi:glucose/arabinose dehydrogenase
VGFWGGREPLHRNPLGLAFNDADGTLWSTEEGPQGGDELNLIVKGKNYGWPEVSLGRKYDGTIVGKGFSAPGFEDPVVFLVTAIIFLAELKQRIREVKPGLDGDIYALTDETFGAVLKIEPAAQSEP